MSDLVVSGTGQIGGSRFGGDPTGERRGPPPKWSNHPVDVPVSLGGFYFRMVMGRERRSKERREQDRQAQKLSTVGNMLFAGSISSVVFSVVIVVVLVYSSILAE